MKKFDAEKETKKVIEFIRNYYKENNLGGAILGISGGKDSGVVAGLLVEALGKENVIGVTLPCHSKEEDANDAKLVSDYYGFNLINFDITNTFDAFKDELKNLGEFNEKEVAKLLPDLTEMLNSKCYLALKEIKEILKDDEYIVSISL